MDENYARIVRVLIASPGDLSAERAAIKDTFVEWNNANTDAGAHLTPVMWESSSVPELGDHPQHVLNSQLIDKSDLLIAMFWAKVGTPTPSAPSGTIEEIREFIDAKGPRRAMLYFCDRPIPSGPDQIDTDSLKKLQDFKQEMKDAGLYASFDTTDNLSKILYRHLDKKVGELLSGKLPLPSDLRESNTEVPRPSWCDASAADPRLHQPVPMGKNFDQVIESFAAMMSKFIAIDGVSNDKYLKLGAHTYMSAAAALDEVLEYNLQQVPLNHRNRVRSIVRQLSNLHDTHMAYLKEPWNVYWERGAEIASELRSMARA